MTSPLFVGVYSVVPTKRRRFFWAAWWTTPPCADPFQKPDVATGGARTREEARAAAEHAAGRNLVETEGRWAGAWVRILRGLAPWPKPREAAPRSETVSSPPPQGSRTWAMAVLDVAPGATADEIKRGFRAVALRTHPDRGGDEAAFMEARRALDIALAGVNRKRRQR